MRQDYTHISFLLDRSGSMMNIVADMEGGFDKLIADQRLVPGKCTVSLYRFDNLFETIYETIPINDVSKLKLEPRYSTALYDSIAKSIKRTGELLATLPENERPAAVIFGIITDGGENSSHEFTLAAIRKMIEHQTSSYNWKFVYLGANQDTYAVGASLGVSRDSTLHYAANAMGTRSMSGSFSKGLTSYRGAVTAGVAPQDFFSKTDQDEQDEQLAAA